MCKGLSIDDVGVSRVIVFREIRPGAGFETGDFVEEKLGGATIEQLGGRWRGGGGGGRGAGEQEAHKVD